MQVHYFGQVSERSLAEFWKDGFRDIPAQDEIVPDIPFDVYTSYLETQKQIQLAVVALRDSALDYPSLNASNLPSIEPPGFKWQWNAEANAPCLSPLEVHDTIRESPSHCVSLYPADLFSHID